LRCRTARDAAYARTSAEKLDKHPPPSDVRRAINAQVGLMRAWLVFAGGCVLYTASQELLSPRAASL
jgi:hypothetical protein